MAVHAHRNPSIHDSQRPPLHTSRRVASCRVVSRGGCNGIDPRHYTAAKRKPTICPSRSCPARSHCSTRSSSPAMVRGVRGAARLPAAHVYAYNPASPDTRARAVVCPLPSATQPPCHPAPPTLRHRLQPSTHVRPCLSERDNILQPEQDRPSLLTGCCDVSGHSGLSLTFPPSSFFPFSISKLFFLCALLLS
jgi:hypothetical protein